MKARYIVEQMANQTYAGTEGTVQREDGRWVIPVGFVVEHPRAFRLVEMGVAEPADEECTLRACMSSDEMKVARRKQDMISRGIMPDDYQRYLDGEILGYNEDGSDIPGPNYQEPDDEDEDDDDE